MRRITVRGLLARKLRLALTALAIVLGVTFVTGTLVLTDTLNRTFDTLIGTAYQHIDFQIRAAAAFNNDTAAAANGTADRKPIRRRSPRRFAACRGRLRRRVRRWLRPVCVRRERDRRRRIGVGVIV